MGISKMNKKGATLKMSFFAVIAVSMMVISIGILMSEYSQRSGVSSDSSFQDLNKLDQISSNVESQVGSITPNDPDPGTDAEANTFKAVFGVLTNIFQPFEIVFGEDGMLDYLRVKYDIPSWVIKGVVSMMVVSLVMTLIAIIFRLGKS
jgi:hypothetical protein